MPNEVVKDQTPLVSLILYVFNERRFIEAAIRSLFGQDYPNLEIVLSDDGSTDGTFDIIQKMADAYRGPHKIIVNRNEQNIGIGSQLNAAIQKSNGELILLANGDDISRPDRVRRTFLAWLVASPHPLALWSALEQVDEQGAPLGRIMDMRVNAPDLAIGMANRFSGAGAASLALDRRVFTAFGPLPDNLILEDSPLFMRAMLLGPVHYIETPLVSYRVHRHNMSQSYAVAEFEEWRQSNRQTAIWHKREGVKAYLQMLRDLHQTPAETWPPQDLSQARWVGMEKVLENAIQRDYYAGDRTVGPVARLRTLSRLGWLVLKTEVKRWFPVIERRNERWHYQRVVEAARVKH